MTMDVVGGARAVAGSLATRLIGMLTVALLPIGLIAIYQTSRLLDEAQALSETALIDRTQRAAARERASIRAAFGAAEALAATFPQVAGSQSACRSIMTELVAKSEAYAYAGFHGVAGELQCGSAEDGTTAGGMPLLPSMSDPRRRVAAMPQGIVTGSPALAVSVPVFDGADFRGYVSISFRQQVTKPPPARGGRLAELVVFNAEGQILSTSIESGGPEGALPRDRELTELPAASKRVFKARNRSGAVRDFALVDIVPDTVYVLGSWLPDSRVVPIGSGERAAIFFPLLMWLASVFVAYFGVSRLVIRHIRRLQGQMRLYFAGQPASAQAALHNAPRELREVADTFRAMAGRVTGEEQRREQDLREKTVLLREVHHRVKNNLQLISSLINMQIRNTESHEAQQLLRRVQERVMALSTIHSSLYTSRNLTMVRADTLLGTILDHLVELGTVERDGERVTVATYLDPVEVSPDQMVPLLLLATEAATNAVKYCGRPADGPPWITVALTASAPGRVSMSIVNSRGSEPVAGEREDGSGLGASLISAFVGQLDADLTVDDHPDRYGVHVAFDIRESHAEGDPDPDPDTKLDETG